MEEAINILIEKSVRLNSDKLTIKPFFTIKMDKEISVHFMEELI